MVAARGENAQYFDLHLHSSHSFDSSIGLAALFSTAHTRGLAGVAITDHDALTRASSPYPDLLVIPGSEIHVEAVHADLIGIGLSAPVPPTLGLAETVDAIHDQGAVVIVPHPFSSLDWYPAIREHVFEIIDRVDAIEVTNPKPHIDNRRARTIADQYKRARVGGSDAHRWEDIAIGVTVAQDIATVDDLLTAIRKRRTDGLLRRVP